MKSLPCYLKQEIDWGNSGTQIDFNQNVLRMCREKVGYSDDPNWECPYYNSPLEGRAAFGDLNINGEIYVSTTEKEVEEDWNNGVFLMNPQRWRWHPGTQSFCSICAILAARHNAGVDKVSDCGYGECKTCSIHKSKNHVLRHAHYLSYKPGDDWTDVDKGYELGKPLISRWMFLVDIPSAKNIMGPENWTG